MDFTRLTDQQLYALAAGSQLNKRMAGLINTELSGRGLRVERSRNVDVQDNTPLDASLKILLLLLPFFPLIYVLLPSRYLAQGYSVNGGNTGCICAVVMCYGRFFYRAGMCSLPGEHKPGKVFLSKDKDVSNQQLILP